MISDANNYGKLFVNNIPQTLPYFIDFLKAEKIESEDLIVQETDVDKLRDDKHVIYDKKLLKFLKNYKETYVKAPKLS